ncbi:MAG: MBL fold metallo-hydrolase [Bacteroidaceae bacterium]|nr:MBL fold metallo-hydrolase [Bacteroidaceae bacterium]
MKITILGTGTSIGVPQIGCECRVCTSKNPKDKRLRCSSLVETRDARILIDCGPDFRQQMLTVPFDRLDGVLITHEHYDHTGGIDDLRPFCVFNDHSVNIFLDSYTAQHLRDRLPYFFRTKLYPGVAHIALHEIQPYDSFYIKETRVTPLPVMHGQLPILGYRIDCPSGKSLGYITDMSSCEPRVHEVLEKVDILVVNALRFNPHPAHQTLEEAVAFAQRIGAPTTRFIHFSHDIGLHDETNAQLSQGMSLAFDGEIIEK